LRARRLGLGPDNQRRFLFGHAAPRNSTILRVLRPIQARGRASLLRLSREQKKIDYFFLFNPGEPTAKTKRMDFSQPHRNFDVSIKCGDGQVVYFMRWILAVESPVCEMVLLEGPWEENSTNQIELREITGPQMLRLLEIITAFHNPKVSVLACQIIKESDISLLPMVQACEFTRLIGPITSLLINCEKTAYYEIAKKCLTPDEYTRYRARCLRAKDDKIKTEIIRLDQSKECLLDVLNLYNHEWVFHHIMKFRIKLTPELVGAINLAELKPGQIDELLKAIDMSPAILVKTLLKNKSMFYLRIDATKGPEQK
jgi:BTB/POZ domain